MSDHIHPAHSSKHGDYERRDIGVAGVVYFLVGMAVAGVFVYFIANGMYSFLDKRFESDQVPVSPLVAAPPADTRHFPPEYKTDSEGADYDKYLEKNFPSPQLETNERTELNKVRLHEEETLSTYDYVDKNAGTIRIPIDRAMELLAQRGLPVRNGSQAPQPKPLPEKAKGTNQ